LARFSEGARQRAHRYERSHVLTQFLREITALARRVDAPAARPVDRPEGFNGSLSTQESFLVIGGSGFIGRQLAARLLERHPQARIVLADLAPPPVSALRPGIDYVPCDVRQPLEGQIGRPAFDRIYNLAAIHREPGHATQEYFDTNVQGATNVCAYASLVGCKRIVFSSSIAVYGPAEGGLSEPDRKHPSTAYGISKFVAEGIHEKWQAAGPGRTLRIVRPGVVYGPGDIGNMLRMIRAVKRGYFVFPGNARNRKSFAYIYGLLDSIEFAETLPDPVFVYNYVEKQTMEMAELVAAVSVTVNRRMPVLRVPRPVLLPLAHAIQWITLGHSPIHPLRVEKAGVSTWVIPQALIDRGFEFKYDFAASLRDWKERAPVDFK
jgi:nucleoside-diphosphate-sugar epimerase